MNTKKPEIKEIKVSNFTEERLKKYKVGVVYLFGSAVEGVLGKGSDLDFGVVLVEHQPLSKSLKIYNQLFELFSREFEEDREIDIVFLQRASLSLQFEVINYGRVIFEISPEFRVNFEEEIIRNYLDFAPFLEEYDKVVMETFR